MGRSPTSAARQRRDPRNDGREGLTVLTTATCIVLVSLFLRPGLVSIGPLLPAIQSYFGLSHTEAALLTTIPDVLMGALALPTPWLARRLGRDRVILAALALLLVAMFARAFSPSKAILFATTAGVGGGIALSGALMAGFIKEKFPARAVLLMSVYATAMSVGAMTSAATTPLVSLAAGWRWGCGLWSGLGVVAVAAWCFVLFRTPRTSAPAKGGVINRLPVANPTAWRIALFFGLVNLTYYACLSWIAAIYREHGMSETQAGFVLAVYSFGPIVSTPLAGMLSRKPDRRRHLAAWSLVMLIGLVGFAAAPDAFPLLYALLIALGIGGAFPLALTLPLDNTTSASQATSWSAFILTIGYLIAALGPFVVGALRDATGGFGWPLRALVGVGVAMAALTPFLKPARHAADD